MLEPDLTTTQAAATVLEEPVVVDTRPGAASMIVSARCRFK